MKNESLYIILSVLMLLLGGVAGLSMANEKVVTEKVIINNTVYEDKIIEIETDYLGAAIDKFMSEVESDDDIRVLGRYDFNDVSVKKVYTDYRVVFVDDEKYFVQFSIDLKFKEADSKSKIKSFNVKVTYEDDEDTQVKLL